MNNIELLIVEDYHELSNVADAFFPKCRVCEVGRTLYGPGPYLMYVGVLYRGHKPSQGEIMNLLLQNNIGLVIDENT